MLRAVAADALVRSVITVAAGDFGAVVATYLASVLYAHIDFVGPGVCRCCFPVPNESVSPPSVLSPSVFPCHCAESGSVCGCSSRGRRELLR
jgi:hypothetical protein